MEVQEIEITINKDGQVEVSVRGVKGEACIDLTKSLEEALGGEVLLREMTSEFQQENPNKLGSSLNIKGQ